MINNQPLEVVRHFKPWFGIVMSKYHYKLGPSSTTSGSSSTLRSQDSNMKKNNNGRLMNARERQDPSSSDRDEIINNIKLTE